MIEHTRFSISGKKTTTKSKRTMHHRSWSPTVILYDESIGHDYKLLSVYNSIVWFRETIWIVTIPIILPVLTFLLLFPSCLADKNNC